MSALTFTTFLYMDWYLKAVRDNYMNFEGRARRKEFWMFTLVNLIIYIVLDIVETVMGLEIFYNSGLLTTIYSLALVLPSLAVGVRRLHDTDKSGWWILIGVVPLKSKRCRIC